MKTTRYLIAVALVGTVACSSMAQLRATPDDSKPTAQHAGKKESQAWLEARDAFAPVNELRSNSDEAAVAATADGTTMRLLGLGSGQDRTVFPPLAAEPALPESSPPPSDSETESRVVDVTINPIKVAEEKSTWRQTETSSQSSSDSELVLLPSVESIGSSTFLASSQSNDRLAYASRAFAPENAVEQAAPANGQYIQNEGEVQWGSPVVASGCCDGCCDTCCTASCQRCCRPPIIVVGTEAVFLSPTVNGSSVFYQFDGPLETYRFGPDTGYGALDDFYAAPRISLGWQGCCWGIMGRYYHLRAAEHAHNPLVGHGSYGQLANQTINVSNILEAYYTDLEVTRNFCLHGCKSQFSFGCRYALISHDESIYGRSFGVDPNSASLIEGGARRNRSAHGTGLTMGLNLRKPLFCNSCAHWFFSGRTSILWGNNATDVESRASVVVAAPATVAAAGSIDGASAWVADDLFIGEIQAGIEWDFALRCLPAKAFFRTAFEYQYWDGSSGFAGSTSFAGFSNGGNTYQATTGSWAPGIIADFVGLSIGTGFTW